MLVIQQGATSRVSSTGTDMSESQLNVKCAENFQQDLPNRDAVLGRVIPGVFAKWFPDNEGNIWHIERTAHSHDTALVLVRPDPNDVGYDRFVVLVDFSLGEESFAAQAIYAQNDESRFFLFSTDPACSTDIPSKIVW